MLVFEARITEYLELILNFTYIFIFLIQLPLLIVLFFCYKFVKHLVYKKNRFLFILFIVIYIMIISPPDIITQSLLFLYVLFVLEFVVFINHLFACYKQFY